MRKMWKFGANYNVFKRLSHNYTVKWIIVVEYYTHLATAITISLRPPPPQPIQFAKPQLTINSIQAPSTHSLGHPVLNMDNHWPHICLRNDRYSYIGRISAFSCIVVVALNNPPVTIYIIIDTADRGITACKQRAAHLPKNRKERVPVATKNKYAITITVSLLIIYSCDLVNFSV